MAAWVWMRQSGKVGLARGQLGMTAQVTQWQLGKAPSHPPVHTADLQRTRVCLPRGGRPSFQGPGGRTQEPLQAAVNSSLLPLLRSRKARHLRRASNRKH